MTMNILLALILAAGVSKAADTLTPLDVKTGLWEMTLVSVRSGTLPIPADALAKMTPAQRAQLEASMKSVPASQTSTRQSCITKQDLTKAFDTGEDAKSCKQTIMTSTSTRQEVKLECDTQGNKIVRTVKVEAVDSSHLKGLVLSTVGNNGRNMEMKGNLSAKFLSSSCGDVKPSSKQE
jgi:Protein of unknown function (DUF3617)